MINWTRVDDLRAEVGADGLDEIVELFLDEVEGIVRRLGSTPEPARFEADLHFMKGGAWNLGFAEFGALCQDGERRAATGRAGEIDIGRIVASYFASKTEFMAGLAAGAGTGASAA
ncbi:Hpt domain-containing protein [Defluviimonas sp. WL0024]|uniref:Hpt domain-containing protein n=2 Tax=Albidovulum TaxID=205889 RepID=A0ABT3J189_9RHOB|nr:MULTISPECIES: Hpt domain-containing protein [Defluviimonas]MCU9848119.1 Hpt domain-containing protein [Defluviimonas sp. WL0024]MCW3781451.1 Hpt domain-containing protein [Defluviimonas salinarum]